MMNVMWFNKTENLHVSGLYNGDVITNTILHANCHYFTCITRETIYFYLRQIKRL